MLLVTNIEFGGLLRESGFSRSVFSTSIIYSTLDDILEHKCKGVKTAEIYWSGNNNGICNILSNRGIQPVSSVNAIQTGMKILQVFDTNSCLLIEIKQMK